jgi:hypothetical protein
MLYQLQAPYTLSDLTPQNPSYNPNDPPDVVQLQLDTLNVLEGKVDINTFSPDYRKRIQDYYRFYGVRYTSKYPFYPKMIRETLDIV